MLDTSGGLSTEFELALPAPPETPLKLLPQACAGGPVITGHEDRKKGKREEVIGVHGERHHEQEVGADREFDVRQPSTAAPVLRRLQLYGWVPPIAYFGVRANAVCTPNSASSTARVLLIVSATPAAISTGIKKMPRFHVFGYSSRCAST